MIRLSWEEFFTSATPQNSNRFRIREPNWMNDWLSVSTVENDSSAIQKWLLLVHPKKPFQIQLHSPTYRKAKRNLKTHRHLRLAKERNEQMTKGSEFDLYRYVYIYTVCIIKELAMKIKRISRQKSRIVLLFCHKNPRPSSSH